MLNRNLVQPLAVLAAIGCIASRPAPALTIAINPQVEHQTFEGWGTSLCWWAENAGKWSEANRNKLIDAIVDPDTGLGYNCFRYNIGGGDQPGHTHLSAARAVPGFKTTETGAYDWTADPYQRNILLGIAARAKSPVFEAFSNSPPWWMTVSGCASGTTDGSDNLKPAYFTKFAEYLADVTQHYKDAHGIVFRTVEPFNEPSSGWWKANGGQEGCGFKSNQAKMVKELGKQLASRNLSPASSVSAGDENALDQQVTALKSYDDSAYGYLGQINSHSYGGWSSRAALATLATGKGKRLWQSESGPLNKGSDTSNVTMWMSNVILQDLRDMRPNAWIDWQVGDDSPNWMTLQLDNTKQTYTRSPRFFMHAAFSRFLRPGSKIIESSDANSVAAIAPSGDLVVVLRNAGASVNDTLDVSKFTNLGTTARLYRFALPGSLARLADGSISAKKLAFTAPAQTLTTVVIPSATSASAGSAKPTTEPLVASIVGHGLLRIHSKTFGPAEIQVFDSFGRLMELRRIEVHASTTEIRMGALARMGVYGVRVRQEGATWTGRIAVPN